MSEVRFRVNMPKHNLSISGHVQEREFRVMNPTEAAAEASCRDINVYFAETKPDELPTFIVSPLTDFVDYAGALQMVKARLEFGFIGAAAFVPESVS